MELPCTRNDWATKVMMNAARAPAMTSASTYSRIRALMADMSPPVLIPGASPSSGALLLHPRGLAGPLPQVVQLRPAHIAPADDLNLVHPRRGQRGRAPDAHGLGHLADGEGLVPAPARPSQGDSCNHLDALPVRLDDLDVHAHRVARGEIGQIPPHLLLFQLANDIHGQSTPHS